MPVLLFSVVPPVVRITAGYGRQRLAGGRWAFGGGAACGPLVGEHALPMR
jgi:hypothetical protein